MAHTLNLPLNRHTDIIVSIYESSREIEKSQQTIFFPYLSIFATLFETLVLRAPEVSGAVLWICWGEGVGLLVFKFLLYTTMGNTILLNAIDRM